MADSEAVAPAVAGRKQGGTLLKRKIFSLTLLVLIFSFLFVGCASSGTISEPKGFVNDFAGMLSDKQEEALEATLAQYEEQTSNEIAVVTVKSLGGQSVEDYTMALAEKWQVGKADKDNGVIILVAQEEKKIRIEVGYGLEPVLTDLAAKQIIDNEMTPRFKQDDFAGGIEQAVKAVTGVIAGTYMPSQSEESGGWPVWLIILVVVIGILILIAILAAAGVTSDGGGAWSSGSGGGSSGGFGGGGFGGGGASGGW